MKKHILLLLALFFFFPIAVSAQDVGTSQNKSEYTLPYPGILPDNPLYIFKVSRDRIISFLIADPQKKASFNLLQADKRLQAGVYLLHKDKKQAKLSGSTILKGVNYFGEAIVSLEHAKKEGKDIGTDIATMSSAAQKHEEVLQEIIPTVPKSEQKVFELAEKRMAEYNAKLQVLQVKK